MQWHFPKTEFHCETEIVLPPNSWSLHRGYITWNKCRERASFGYRISLWWPL